MRSRRVAVSCGAERAVRQRSPRRVSSCLRWCTVAAQAHDSGDPKMTHAPTHSDRHGRAVWRSSRGRSSNGSTPRRSRCWPRSAFPSLPRRRAPRSPPKGRPSTARASRCSPSSCGAWSTWRRRAMTLGARAAAPLVTGERSLITTDGCCVEIYDLESGEKRGTDGRGRGDHRAGRRRHARDRLLLAGGERPGPPRGRARPARALPRRSPTPASTCRP